MVEHDRIRGQRVHLSIEGYIDEDGDFCLGEQMGDTDVYLDLDTIISKGGVLTGLIAWKLGDLVAVREGAKHTSGMDFFFHCGLSGIENPEGPWVVTKAEDPEGFVYITRISEDGWGYTFKMKSRDLEKIPEGEAD